MQESVFQKVFLMLINLTPVLQQNRIQYFKQTSFHEVTSNNASLGLRENVILTNIFGAKIVQEIWYHYGDGEVGKAPMGGPHLPKRCAHAP